MINGNRDSYLAFVKMLYISVLFLACIVSPKITEVFGFYVTADIFIFPLSFALIDAISEVYGRKKAQETLYHASSCLVISAVFLWLISGVGINGGELDSHYTAVLKDVPLSMVAGAACLMIADSVNILIFHRIRKLTGEAMLWLRCLISTAAGQFIDSAIWTTAVKWSSEHFFSLLINTYVMKIAYAAMLIPITYLAVNIIRFERKKQTKSPLDSPA